MKLIYDIKDKPKFGQMLIYALQQMLAIFTATIAVPASVGNGMTAAAAMFGAGVGTLVYQCFTKFKSPVFLGSSFAFIPSMAAAFAGAVSMSVGYAGLIIGGILAGLVYVIIALVVKTAGVAWIGKLMPPVVIGPTVSVIGLGCAGYAVSLSTNFGGSSTANSYIALLVGVVTLLTVCVVSVFGKKGAKLIPFVIGILAGYALALILTVIGKTCGNEALLLIDFSHFAALTENGVTLSTFFKLPSFTFAEAVKGLKDIDATYIGTVAVAYMPVSFVVFAEHIADHRNLSSIIEKDLLTDPGLNRTLIGDGVGSMAGAFFGGCPNTTYGESVACVAITGNASISTITTAAFVTIICSMISPLVAFINSIPSCVMGGVCFALYGFIAVSGLKMIQTADLGDNKNLFTVSSILIAGIGGLSLTFGKITITNTACALILGVIINQILSAKDKKSSNK